MEDQIIIHINREQNVLLQRLARKYCCTVDDLIEEAVYEYCADDRKDEPQTEPLPKTINGVKIADAVAWADKWLEDNSVSEIWDMIRTLRDATEWQDEPQTYVINPQEPTNDDKCFECDDFFTCGGQCNKIEDEPQTDCPWK